MRSLTIFGLDNIGQIKPSDDIAELIFEKSREGNLILLDRDLIVISQKIVSKAKGLLVDISKIKPTRRAKSLAKQTGKDPRVVDLILRETDRIVRAASQALIVRRKNGLICPNAGVDKSSVQGRSIYSRLPPNSDSSARQILVMRQGMERVPVAVIRGLSRMKQSLDHNLSKKLLLGRRLDLLR